MKIKTSELIDQALDWAVAKCLTGGEIFQCGRVAHQVVLHSVGGTTAPYFMKDSGVIRCAFEPSENWAQGGPIIERGHIHTWTDRKDAAYAGHPDSYWVAEMTELGGIWWGPTPLIAAMRCYVASELGDEVAVPAEIHNTI